MRRFFRWLAFSAAVSVSATFVGSSSASIVERVVAVVGERPILLTDLRKRARPYLLSLYGQPVNPAQRAAEETKLYRDMLNKMIDERLEEQTADKSRIAVTTEEIDGAVRQRAQANNMTSAQFYTEVKRQGFTEQDFREEMRRQVLEGKLIQLRVMPRVRVSEEDVRANYGRWVKEMGDERAVDLRLLALRIPPNATDAQYKEREDLAHEIVRKARAGEDFCKLVTQYSEDLRTKPACGSSGSQPISNLLPALQDAAKALKEGEVSEPMAFGSEAFVITYLAKGPHIPTFDDVKPLMRERAMTDVIERQRKLWLQDLRRGLYIDVRL